METTKTDSRIAPIPCEHIMDSGRIGGSPRVGRRRFCCWHNRLHTAHFLPGNPMYEPPVLDSAD